MKIKKNWPILFLFLGCLSAGADEGRLERLRRGEVLTEGGHLDHGAWGRMEGVIQAPPLVVWKLFIQPGIWKTFKLPNLRDSRAVDEQAVAQVGSDSHVDVFYKALGGRTIDSLVNRRPGGNWISHTFQFYDLPWPLADRWFILKNHNDETRLSEGVYRCEWEGAGGNVRTMEGSLVLAPFEGDKNQTLLEYQIRSDPGSHIPRFLLKWGLKKTMPEAIQAIRRGAASVYGRPPPLLKTQ